MIEKLKETFLEEVKELLENLEGDLLTLENDPNNASAMNAVFRALHSIKGSAGMFGYDELSAFAHEVETVLEHFRSNKLPASGFLIDLTLTARDYILNLLEHPELATEEQRVDLLKRLHEILPDDQRAKVVEKKETIVVKKAVKEKEAETIYSITFSPKPDFYKHGAKPEQLVAEICDLGNTSILCDSQNVPSLSEFDPESCYLSWKILLTTKESLDKIKDIFIFAENDSLIEIEEIPEENLFSNGEVKRIGEILKDKLNLSTSDIQAALGQQKPLGEILMAEHNATQGDIDSALLAQKHARQIVQPNHEDQDKKTIRIRSEKLDGLLNLVGELVTVQAQLSQLVRDSSDRKLENITDYIKRLTTELRSTSMELRLIPVETLFAKFRRLVRDLSKNLNKEFDLVIEGGETELDKSVIEALSDPVMHLVRNSADHGIESPEERKRAGKNPTGTITVQASHAGSFVRISVRDDGAGLNEEKILKKAQERGLVLANAVLKPSEIHELIFAPGFSTADTVTNVSGRGVGMDVVKTAIDQLGGRVGINTVRGQGTTFTLDIPLTLAIIDGFLVRSEDRNFVIPLQAVDTCFERKRPLGTERLLEKDGEFIPYYDSYDFFAIDGKKPELEEVLIARVFDSKVAIGFDQIIGGFQTVVKPIGELARHARGVSGSAILANGGIAFIVDVQSIAQEVSR